MNFTREPIIETIITPKDGFKLVIRSVLGDGEEYAVDALEVISFGSAIFYRSFEKPKPFLLPVSHFEVIETRETKVVLKNTALDKTIKIAGGKEGMKSSEPKEPQVETKEEGQQQLEKKKKRSRKRKGNQYEQRKEEASTSSLESENVAQQPLEEGPAQIEPVTTHVRKIIPPPSTLISDTMSRYRSESIEEAVPLVQEETMLQDHRQDFIDQLDSFWMDDRYDFRVDNELDSEEFLGENLHLASSPEEDEPIGNTHIEEKLMDENPLHVSPEDSDDQK